MQYKICVEDALKKEQTPGFKAKKNEIVYSSGILSYLCLRRQNNYPSVSLLIGTLESQFSVMLTSQSYYERQIRNRSALNSVNNYFMQM